MAQEQVVEPKKEKKQKPKLTSRVLRDRGGVLSERALEVSRDHAKIKKQIKAVLADGPKSVPEVVDATGLESSELFWHLMSMRKYGDVVDHEEDGSYVRYALKPKQEKNK